MPAKTGRPGISRRDLEDERIMEEYMARLTALGAPVYPAGAPGTVLPEYAYAEKVAPVPTVRPAVQPPAPTVGPLRSLAPTATGLNPAPVTEPSIGGYDAKLNALSPEMKTGIMLLSSQARSGRDATAPVVIGGRALPQPGTREYAYWKGVDALGGSGVYGRREGLEVGPARLAAAGVGQTKEAMDRMRLRAEARSERAKDRAAQLAEKRIEAEGKRLDLRTNITREERKMANERKLAAIASITGLEQQNIRSAALKTVAEIKASVQQTMGQLNADTRLKITQAHAALEKFKLKSHEVLLDKNLRADMDRTFRDGIARLSQEGIRAGLKPDKISDLVVDFIHTYNEILKEGTVAGA